MNHSQFPLLSKASRRAALSDELGIFQITFSGQFGCHVSRKPVPLLGIVSREKLDDFISGRLLHGLSENPRAG